MLQGIRIRNYRIFNDDKAGALIEDLPALGQDLSLSFSAGISPSIPLSNLTALIGRNATGKSTFFDALSFVSDCTTMGCSTASTQHGRPGFAKLLGIPGKPMEFEFLFSMIDGKANGNGSSVKGAHENAGLKEILISYGFGLAGDSHRKPHYTYEKVILCEKDGKGSWKQTICLDLTEGRGTAYLSGQMTEAGVSDTRIPGIRSYGAIMSYPVLTALYHEISHWFFCNFSRERNGGKIPIAPGGHKHLNCDGSNLNNVLDYLRSEKPAIYRAIMDKISGKIPDIGKEKGQLPKSFRESPSKLFLYLLLLIDPIPRPLICLETPDMGLYHDMVDVLASEFRDYSLRHPQSQILFTTHNPYILESMAPHEVLIFRRVEENVSNLVDIECAGSKPIVAEMYRQGVGMGAIWYAGHFDD